jgi:hypothetical protein
MFTKSGITELHSATHESLDILLDHVATVPDALLRQPLPGFGFPTVWRQLVHILTVEEGWVHDLRSKPFDGWFEEDCPTIDALRAAKERIRNIVHPPQRLSPPKPLEGLNAQRKLAQSERSLCRHRPSAQPIEIPVQQILWPVNDSRVFAPAAFDRRLYQAARRPRATNSAGSSGGEVASGLEERRAGRTR